MTNALIDLLSLQDDGVTVFQNVRNHSPNDTALCLKYLNKQKLGCENLVLQS